MNVKKPWLIAVTTLAVAGFGSAGLAVASDGVQLNDAQQAPVALLSGDIGPVATHDSADSAGSPGSSPFEASGLDADSPADSGRPDSSPESSDSPGESPFESAGSAHDSPDDPGYAPAPAPAPAPAAPPVHAGDTGGSADSPAPARPRTKNHSGDSGDSGDSSGSAD